MDRRTQEEARRAESMQELLNDFLSEDLNELEAKNLEIAEVRG